MYSPKTISNLPQSTLSDLLLFAVKELLEALEGGDAITIKAKQKQAEIIYSAILDENPSLRPVKPGNSQDTQLSVMI